MKGTNEEFANVLTAVKSADKDVEKVLKEPNFLDAFTRQVPDLVSYLLSRARSIVDIAFGVRPCTDPNSQKLCRRMLTVTTPVFSQKMVQTKGLPAGLREFSNHIHEASPENITTFCMTLQFFSKITNGSILVCINDGATFVGHLLDLQKMGCVHDLLFYLTSDGHPQFAQFLDKNQIAELLWNRYESTKALTNLTFLSQVVSSLDPSSVSMLFISERERIEQIMEMALQTSDTKLSDVAMTIIYEMCSHCDEDDESEESLFVRVFQYVVERIDDIADFIASDTLYTLGKTRAIEMLVGIVSATEEVTENMFDMFGSLFKQMVSQPQFSILHCACVKVFTLFCDVGAELQELDEKFSLRATIIDEFTHRDTNKLFYGHLFTIADLLHEHEDFEETSPEWKEFIGSTYQEMKTIVESQYGGQTPSRAAVRANASCDEVCIEKRV